MDSILTLVNRKFHKYPIEWLEGPIKSYDDCVSEISSIGSVLFRPIRRFHGASESRSIHCLASIVIRFLVRLPLIGVVIVCCKLMYQLSARSLPSRDTRSIDRLPSLIEIGFVGKADWFSTSGRRRMRHCADAYHWRLWRKTGCGRYRVCLAKMLLLLLLSPIEWRERGMLEAIAIVVRSRVWSAAVGTSSRVPRRHRVPSDICVKLVGRFRIRTVVASLHHCSGCVETAEVCWWRRKECRWRRQHGKTVDGWEWEVCWSCGLRIATSDSTAWIWNDVSKKARSADYVVSSRQRLHALIPRSPKKIVPRFCSRRITEIGFSK